MDWLNALWAAIVAGIIMGIWAMMMGMFGVTRMRMADYEGCMLTGQPSGMATMVMGIVMHLVLSIIIGFIYAFFFELIGHSGWLWGLLFGVVHWLIAGVVLPMMDSMNGCVSRSVVQPMKLYASGYGTSAALVFLIGHLLFGLFMGIFYSVS